MSYISVDIESDGNIIGKHSMISFGAVLVDDKLDKTFYAELKPISDEWIPESLAISGFSREKTLEFEDPKNVMERFDKWVRETSHGKPIFFADNNGFDASWINWYFLTFVGKNPFGWSSRRIGDLFCGYKNDMYYRWKKHRKTSHSHNALDDCIGNAEALLALRDMGFKISLK